MKRGFTILELLVASLLLGMLVSILTMLFNQSSIAWRSGVAGTKDLEVVRENIAEVREEADNVFIWDGEVHRVVGLWDDNGSLRNRAWDVNKESDGASSCAYLSNKGVKETPAELGGSYNEFVISVGSTESAEGVKTYSVNVKSAGPNRKFDDYDDIWSNPNELVFE